MRKIFSCFEENIFEKHDEKIDLILGPKFGGRRGGCQTRLSQKPNFDLFVQRLRSKPWTYKSKFSFFFVFFSSVFHSVSNFVCLNDQAYTCLIHFYKKGHHSSCIIQWETTFEGRRPLEDDL